MKNILLKTFKYIGIGLISIILSVVVYYSFFISIDIPQGCNMELLKLQREKKSENFYTIGNNWLKKNKQGIWEMYLEGGDFERGVIHGKLAEEMVVSQEDNFVGQIKTLIPSDAYLKFLKYFIVWFNRDIDDYIPEEFKREIYGVSFSASKEYNFIGSNYERILNYHAAHDIGHALQDKNLVPGCTSFSTWDAKSEDSSLIVARNFDFFVGEGFAEDKIICFVKPDSGYKFTFVTWAGFTGVVSGMNEKGLTVTLNASKSDVPTASAMPISLLAREILQYASTSEEAYKIAEKRMTFVSEAIMIGSGAENKTFIIEKSPSKIGMYESTGNQISCSNHFQGSIFNSENDIKERSSVYRYKRLQQLLEKYPKLNPTNVASILRDQIGIDDKNIGMGNEKALNQLIAHHAVIFKPQENKMWLSANPYQLGEFVAYDIQAVFTKCSSLKSDTVVAEELKNIPADSFLLSNEYKNYMLYKEYKKHFLLNKQGKNIDKNPSLIFTPEIDTFIATNPEFYYTYWLVGDYYKFNKKEYAIALKYYEIALAKEVPRDNEIEYLNNAIKECKEKTIQK